MKETIAVLFGGQSSEHEVSCMSVLNIIEQIDKEAYDLLLIGITREGRWLLVPSEEEIRSGAWRQGSVQAVISPDAQERCVIITQDGQVRRQRVDVVFPVLHGLYGEDGTVQGLLELARIPYVGCGVLASAVSMDKAYTKVIADHLGIRQARYQLIFRQELEHMDGVLDRIEERLPYPVFVKPCNAGSSLGVSKASDRKELAEALREAARHDRKILAEETLVGHEVECAVFGGGRQPAEASGVGEILAAGEFYDFEGKYYNPQSRTVTDPQLPGNAAEIIRQEAKAMFQAVDGYGLARVDFFVTEQGEVVFNEINTMPGFTAISMYPTLWEARGVTKAQLIQNLIDSAKERWNG